MGLSGSLEDISIVDVLQILGMARKHGVLHLEKKNRKAQIGFTDGTVVAANIHPPLMRLTDILIDRRYISEEDLWRALEVHRQQGDRVKPIGSTLLEMEKLSIQQIEDAVGYSIQAIVNEVASWTDGEFLFEMGGSTPAVDPRFLPPAVPLSVGISPQELLIEAARIHDEALERMTKEKQLSLEAADAPEEPRDRPTEQEPPLPPSEKELTALEEVPDEEVTGDSIPPVLLFTTDSLVQETIETSLKEALGSYPVVLHIARTFEDARHLLVQLGDISPLLVVDIDTVLSDASRGQQGIQSVLQARRESGKAPLITFGSGRNPRLLAGVLSAGVASHVPRPVGVEKNTVEMDQFIVTLAQTIARELSEEHFRKKLQPGSPRQMTYVESLYRSMLELRRSYHSVTVSLDVLRFVADHMERAILFLVYEKQMIGLGGFGVQGPGVADTTKKIPTLRIPIEAGSAVQRVIETKTVHHATRTHSDAVLRKLYEAIGRPVRTEALLIPIVVSERITSIIYSDNGRRNIEVCSPEPLGILVEHAGLLLENLLLRRKLSRGKKSGDDLEKDRR